MAVLSHNIWYIIVYYVKLDFNIYTYKGRIELCLSVHLKYNSEPSLISTISSQTAGNVTGALRPSSIVSNTFFLLSLSVCVCVCCKQYLFPPRPANIIVIESFIILSSGSYDTHTPSEYLVFCTKISLQHCSQIFPIRLSLCSKLFKLSKDDIFIECCPTKANKNINQIDTLLMYAAFIFSCVLIECVFLKNLLVRHGNHTDRRGTWEQGYFTTSFPHGQIDTFNVFPKVAFSSELFYALTTSTSTIIPIPSWEENKVETNS